MYEKVENILDASKQNAVQVKVWYSSFTKFGHATIKTFRGGQNGEGIFIDFLPEGAHNGSVWFFFGKRGTGGESPDVIVNLYGLEVDRINQAWESMKDNISWAINGQIGKEGRYHTSTSLCATLLIIGGIKEKYDLNIDSEPVDIEKRYYLDDIIPKIIPLLKNIVVLKKDFFQGEFLEGLESSSQVLFKTENIVVNLLKPLTIQPHEIANLAQAAYKVQSNKFTLENSDRQLTNEQVSVAEPTQSWCRMQ